MRREGTKRSLGFIMLLFEVQMELWAMNEEILTSYSFENDEERINE